MSKPKTNWVVRGIKGFHIKARLHKAKGKGADRLYIHLFSNKAKKWKNIYTKDSKYSVWLTFENRKKVT